jgi:hypothetical protein
VKAGNKRESYGNATVRYLREKSHKKPEQFFKKHHMLKGLLESVAANLARPKRDETLQYLWFKGHAKSITTDGKERDSVLAKVLAFNFCSQKIVASR